MLVYQLTDWDNQLTRSPRIGSSTEAVKCKMRFVKCEVGARDRKEVESLKQQLVQNNQVNQRQ